MKLINPLTLDFTKSSKHTSSTLLFLDWQPAAAAPGGAAQVQLATFQAVMKGILAPLQCFPHTR